MKVFWLILGLLFVVGSALTQTQAKPIVKVNTPEPLYHFDKTKAFEVLKKQVEFGPRVPASKASTDCAEYLKKELEKYCKKVEFQPFEFVDGTKVIPMKNIIAHINPDAAEKIILCAHWDTRPIADLDPDPVKKLKPIPGANDGASGVAVLLELARALSLKPIDTGIIIVLFDGEDYGEYPAKMLLGSQYYASTIKKPIPKYAILLDMVGDKDLKLSRDLISYRSNQRLINDLEATAKRLGYKNLFDKSSVYKEIYDDHVSLIAKGVPSVDLIDFDYPVWHTSKDNLDQVSADSLEKIGFLLEAYLRGN